MTRRSGVVARAFVALAALLGVTVTAALGFWQLGRAETKAQLWAQREARETLPPMGWPDMADVAARQDWEAVFDRTVRLTGVWVPEATVFLDNRPMNGRPGFFVLTPLRLDGSDVAVVVQRGWQPRRADDRTAVTDVPTAAGPVEIVGRLAPAPSKLYEFGSEAGGRIRQNIDLGAYATEWSLQLYPVSVQQSEPAAPADGLSRDWSRVGADVHKHYGYAFQWFGLCSLILVLYVWFQIIAPRRRG